MGGAVLAPVVTLDRPWGQGGPLPTHQESGECDYAGQTKASPDLRRALLSLRSPHAVVCYPSPGASNRRGGGPQDGWPAASALGRLREASRGRGALQGGAALDVQAEPRHGHQWEGGRGAQGGRTRSVEKTRGK